METPSLNKLAKSIPLKERKDLLDKILNSISFKDSSRESMYQKETDKAERDRRIKQDYANEGIFTRFLIFMQRILTGEKKYELYLKRKLKKIRKRIQRKFPAISGYDYKDVSMQFGRALYEVYKAVFPIKHIYTQLACVPDILDETLITILEQYLPKVKHSLFDLMSEDDIEEVYINNSTKDSIRTEIKKRLATYLDTLPKDAFDEFEGYLLPVLYIKSLVLFPYKNFFSSFGVTIFEQPEKNAPNFSRANAKIVLPLIERLYYALYSILKIGPKVELEDRIIEWLLYIIKEDKTHEVSEEEIAFVKTSIKNVINSATEFINKVPVADLIRYLRGDPYFKMVFYLPFINVKQFYSSYIRIRFMGELEEQFPHIRERVIERRINDIFKGHSLFKLRHYNIDKKELMAGVSSLPDLMYTKSVNLLYNFIIKYYKVYIQELIQKISHDVLVQNRITQNRILYHASTVEDLEDKIYIFDHTLSEDSDDGKTLERLRRQSKKEKSRVKMVRTIITQKNKEAKALIGKGLEAFEGIQNILKEIRTMSGKRVKDGLLATFYFMGKNRSLYEIIEKTEGNISIFISLLHQVLDMESGD